MDSTNNIGTLAVAAFTMIAGTLLYKLVPVQYRNGEKAFTGGLVMTAASLLVASKTKSENIRKVTISTAGLGMLTMIESVGKKQKI